MHYCITRIVGVVLTVTALAGAQGRPSATTAESSAESVAGGAASAADSDAAATETAAESQARDTTADEATATPGGPFEGAQASRPGGAGAETVVSLPRGEASSARTLASRSAAFEAEAMPLASADRDSSKTTESSLKFVLGGEAPRVHAGIGSAHLRHTDSGFAVFTEERWTESLALSVGADILPFLERWRLSVDADWSREVHRSVGLFGGHGKSRLNAHTWGLGASLRYALLRWCQPYVHIWGGLAATAAWIAVPSIHYTSDSARKYLPASGAAIGTTFWGPVLRSSKHAGDSTIAALGLRVEGGYLFSGAFDFDYDLQGSGASPFKVTHM